MRNFLISFLVLALIFLGGYAINKQGNNNNNLFAYQFSASETQFAFLHTSSNKSRALVVFDGRSGKFKKFTHSSKILSSPKFDADGQLLVSLLPQNKRGQKNLDDAVSSAESSLLRCEISSEQCVELFSFDGGIGNSTKLPSGAILFVAGKAEAVADPLAPSRPYVGYRKGNFYVYSQGENIRKLTTIDSPQLNSLSVAGNRVVFEYYPNIHFLKTYGQSSSKIYSGIINTDESGLSVDVDVTKPFLSYGKNIDIKPSISPNGKYLAFLTASSGHSSSWVYDIVIYDLEARKSKRQIYAQEEGDGPRSLSMPIFVNNNVVRYAVFSNGGYLLKEYSLQENRISLVEKITEIDIHSNKNIIIKVN